MKIVNKTIHLVFLFICTAFLFFSCENFFSPVKAAENADPAPAVEEGSGKTGLVKISLNKDSSRTILPNTPVFEKYRLEFSHATLLHADEIIDEPYKDIALGEGDWTITAYGCVLFNGDLTDAASGSTTVTVTSGGTTAALITVSSGIEGADGKFSWSLSAPQGIEADSWSVTMKKYKTLDDPVISKSEDYNFSAASLNESGEVDCAPGYYLVNMCVKNDLQSASRTEIVFIQSGLVSTMNCSFTAGNFVRLITLSGTVSLTAESNPISLTYCELTLKSENGEEIISTKMEADGSWTMSVESREEENLVKLSLWARTENNLPISCTFDNILTIKDSDIADIALAKQFIIVSGTLEIRQDGVPLEEYENLYMIETTTQASYYASLEEDGSWMMLVEPKAQAVQVSFTAQDLKFGIEYEFTGDWQIYNTSVTGILLKKDLSSVAINGTLSAGTAGIDLSIGNQIITLRESSVYDFGSFRSGKMLDTNGEVDKDGNWEYTITVDNPASFYVFAIIYDENKDIQSVYRMENILEIGAGDEPELDIDLSQVEKVTCTISGTLAGYEEGETYSLYSCSVPVIEEEGALPGRVKALRGAAIGGSPFVRVTDYGICKVIDGNWSMAIPVSQTDYDVFFYLFINGESLITIIPVKAGSEDQRGITIDIENMIVFDEGLS